MIFFLCLLIGVIAGLRAATAPAAVSWAAALGWLNLEGSWASFMGAAITPYILTILAIGEIIGDKLPVAKSRKLPPSFIGRTISGAFSGAVLGIPSGNWIAGLILGAIGAVLGTLGGYEFRARLVKATGGRDLPIALLEDAIAILGALAIVSVAA
jgi:uncharacterized membrane protein